MALTLVTPELLVTAGEVRLALAPEPAAVNATVTFGTGLLLASRTVTCSAEPNAVFTVADCVPPPDTMMLAGGPIVGLHVAPQVSWRLLPCAVSVIVNVRGEVALGKT